ncbi:hypothetical protein BaRGS_00022470, partial [Batillaria attramentaria]
KDWKETVTSGTMRISKSMAAFLAIVLFQAGYLFCLFFSPSGTQAYPAPIQCQCLLYRDMRIRHMMKSSTSRQYRLQPNTTTLHHRTRGTLRLFPHMKKSITDKQSRRQQHTFLCRRPFFGVTDTHCPSSRMGNEGDGGWNICNDPAWVPRKPCIVYSFGVGFDFSFDDEVAEVYGCQVFSFDPSMKTESYQRSKLVKFFNIGIGDEGTRGGGTWNISSYTVTRGNETWNISSFSKIREMLNHTAAVIDVVKMDIEWGEWDALPSMIKEGQLVNVRQFAVEFHVEKEEQKDKRKLLTYLGILRNLQEIGFRRYMTHMNPYGIPRALRHSEIESCCYEVYFLNDNFKRAR